MEFFPFFGRPYYYNQNRYMNGYYSRRQNTNKSQAYEEKYEQNLRDDRIKEKYSDSNHYNKCQQNRKPINNYDTPVFEIFGIKLFFDDVLIIALIFFLYNEGVRDDMLFISLILILLS